MDPPIDNWWDDEGFWNWMVDGCPRQGEGQGDAAAGSGIMISGLEPLTLFEAQHSPASQACPTGNDFLPGTTEYPIRLQDRTNNDHLISNSNADRLFTEDVWSRTFWPSSLNHSLVDARNLDLSFPAFGEAMLESSSSVQGIESMSNDTFNLEPSHYGSLELSSAGTAVQPSRNIGAGDERFTFESRAVPIGDAKVRAAHERLPADPSALRCTFPGCRSSRTFKRKYELQRHMKKHGEARAFPCPVEHCDKVDGNAFYRPDKLTHHLSTAHSEDEICLECAVTGCQMGPLTLDLARVHAHSHYEWRRCNYAARGLDNLKDLRQCRLRDCAKMIPIGSMQEHLRVHSNQERMEQARTLKTMGYDAVSCNIRCPICVQTLPNHETFATHVDSVHEAKSNGHATAFWDSLDQVLGDKMPDQRTGCWSLWRPLNVVKSKFQGVLCPECGASPGSIYEDGWYYVDHHLHVLGDNSALKHYRREILRLYPGFARHPVFSDIISASWYWHDYVDLK